MPSPVPDADRLFAHGLDRLGAGDLAAAAASLRAAVDARPDHFDAWVNLGVALASGGRFDDAAAATRRAVALQPAREEPYANLAQFARRRGRLAEAVAVLQQAVAAGVAGPNVYNNLGSCLRMSGRAGEAVAAFRRAIDLAPGERRIWDNYLYALLFDPAATPAVAAAEHRRWAATLADPLRPQWRPHANDRSPDRRLRVGYVSPDFRGHPVGLFMEPILANHDRRAVEAICYADVVRPDAATATLRAMADGWRDTRGLDDAALAAQIRADGVDVLIDLTLHMGGSRLLAFARRPAPVQVTYLGYAASTGLPAIDYRLTDPHVDPPSDSPATESATDVERLVRLPESYWCYRPPAVAPPPPADPPVVANGFPTFGSFNAAAKVNPDVVAVWARLLHAVPTARLLVVLGGVDPTDPHLLAAFARHGVGPDRLRLVPFQPYERYLGLYAEADVALDTFPYNGGTTTLDALWMGVPVVTLAGRAGVGRAGASVLANAGLGDLVAATPDAYVAAAAGLAADVPRLVELRRGLRDRLRRSPLTDEPRFVRHLEAAYRGMWQAWCGRDVR